MTIVQTPAAVGPFVVSISCANEVCEFVLERVFGIELLLLPTVAEVWLESVSTALLLLLLLPLFFLRGVAVMVVCLVCRKE